MKRLAWMLILGLLGPASAGLAYDGPGTPLTYDRLINNIRVVMTSQPVILSAGRARFTLKAYVPIEPDTVGRKVTLEIRRSTTASYVVVYSCDADVTSIPVGGVAEISCLDEIFAQVVTPPAPTTVGLYPYVSRPASSPESGLIHDGREHRLNVNVVTDDAYEQNDGLPEASDLGTPTTTVTLTNLVYLDSDFYRFTVPAGAGAAEVKIQFYNQAADLDLWIYDNIGSPIAASLTSTDDEERVGIPVGPGQTYYIGVEPGYDSEPAFYNLTLTVTAPDIVTITQLPGGVPNPVGSKGQVQLSAQGQDSLGHALSYTWSQVCSSQLNGLGTFADRNLAATLWTAPENTTASMKTCTLKVTVEDINGVTAIASFSQGVGPAGDTVTITAQPSSTVNPVTPPNPTNLTVGASDTLGHVLSYSWTATCPTLSGTGTFAPSANVQSPSWTPPSNKTGTQQTCTLTVIANDNQGQTATAGLSQRVDPSPHTLQITAGPSGTPATVASSGAVSVSVTAVDSYDHQLNYVWTASCGGGLTNGTFANGGTATPTWTAPANLTGLEQTCQMGVTVNDGQGKTVSGSYQQKVAPLPHTVTITTPPAGSPNPVASSKVVALSVAATDSYSHPLTYTWSSSCPTLGSAGVFANANVQNPTWTAPTNLTGSTHTCTMSVQVRDTQGQTANAQFPQSVTTAPHEITFSAGPSGSINPVPSGGVVAVSATAQDSFLHEVSYSWSATCPAELGGNGTFSSQTAQNPNWTAPANLTGATQTCTIQVLASDGLGTIGSKSYQQGVSSAAHTLTISTPPSGSPNPVASAGSAALSVQATDSLNHAVTYLWTASCSALGGPGTFAPDATSRTPTWTAPANLTGGTQACTISVVATDTTNTTAAASFQQQVSSEAHTLSITDGPSGSPNPTGSASTAALTVTAVDSLNHSLSYLWQANCPGMPGQGGTFSPSAADRTPTWTAPTNLTGVEQPCTMSVTVTDGLGESKTESYSQGVASVAHSLTMTVPPTGSPNPVASSGVVTLNVAAVDSLNHALTYAWDATCAAGLGSGTFAPSASAPTPTWQAPANTTGVPQTCSIRVVIGDGHGESVEASFTQGLSPTAHTLTLTVPPTGAPNPVASSGSVAMRTIVVDSYDHPVSYAWSANCPGLAGGGTFVPSPSVAAPTWQAPRNLTGSVAACTIEMAANDGHGESVAASYAQFVSTAVHSITISTAASGTPNPSGAGAPVVLGVTAVDSFDHELSYIWQASCPGSSGSGKFSPNQVSATPTWTPPATNGADISCILQVSISDAFGQTATSFYQHQVTAAPAPHTITFDVSPIAVPNPVASAGTAALTASAADSLGHPVAYQWSASCLGLSGNGTFSPSASERTPTWTAPANGTGTPQVCALEVVATDGLGTSANGSYALNVSPGVHTVTITAGPSGVPNPSAAGTAVALQVTAVDSLAHALTYAWQASCAGAGGNGSFAPSAAAQAPSWTPPSHPTNEAFTCTIQVDVADGLGGSATGLYTQSVLAGAPPAHTLTITIPPTGAPNPVLPSGQVVLSVGAVDSLNHALAYVWSATCPTLGGNGAFTPSANVQAPTWVAPVNATGSAQTCTIAVSVDDGHGETKNASYTQSVSTSQHSLTLSGPPSGAPNPSSPGVPVQLNVTAVDTFGHTLSYIWQSSCSGSGGQGKFLPNATVQSATWTPPPSSGEPLTCILSVLVMDGQGSSVEGRYAQTVNAGAPAHSVTFSTPPSGSPNPVAPGGNVVLATAALDSQGHALTYQWTATCPTLGGSGGFSPSATVQNPNWAAPANSTGSAQPCTLTVVASDGLGESASASHTQNVSTVAHAVTITAGPTGAPNPSSPGAGVALSVAATDSLNHSLEYAWQASCPGVAGTGTFAPSASFQSPSWAPPINATGAAFTCTIRVDVTDGLGGAATGQYLHNVSAGTPTHNVTITSGPTSTPNPVASGGTALLNVTAIDSLGHALTLTWNAACPSLGGNGSFSPSASAPAPTWNAPSNSTGSQQTCTITVVASDGLGQTATGTLAQRVNSTAVTHTLTITPSPFGVPNPSGPGVPVTLSAEAVDSLGHPLTYVWQASCSGSSGSGSFAPNAAVQTPSWKPPTLTGSADLDCVLQVTAYDNQGKSATAFYTQKVKSNVSPPHSLIITSSPTGVPNPVASASVTALSVTASDSLDHELSYAWTATCPGLGDAGIFAPGANVRNPAWTAPPNLTGAEQTCTLGVTVSDGQGETVQASYAQRVSSKPHTLVITAGPSGTPNPVGVGNAVQLNATVADSLNHQLTYVWSASCPGTSNGSFVPGPTSAAPVWTPPTGPQAPFTCVITLIVNDGTGKSVQGTYQQVIGTGTQPPHTVSFTTLPGGNPNPVASAGAVALGAAATDTLNHPLTYAWTASCPGLSSNGTFAPSPTGQTPTWLAPANTGTTAQSCTIQVTARDGVGQEVTASFVQTVNPTPPTHTLEITGPPNGTPNPVASNGAVALSVTAVDSAGHTLSYVWQASCGGVRTNGTFSNPTAPAPVWTAPVNPTGADILCVISVGVSDGTGLSKTAFYSQTVQSVPHTLTITLPPSGSPNPAESDGEASIAFLAVDSLLHPLTYAWTATCPGLSESGSFSPDANVVNPTWEAPTNFTGLQKSCTITVVVGDGQGKSETASYTQFLDPGLVPVTIVVTNWLGDPLESPTGTPPSLLGRPNYAAVLYRADGTTEGHSRNVFQMNDLLEWPLDAQFAVGEPAILKVWRNETSGFSPFWENPTPPGWKDNPAKQQLAGVAITIQANATYTIKALVDDDKDGMDDYWERYYGLNPGDPGDATLDPDVDTLTNVREFELGTHPFKADTDGDGVNDNVEQSNGDNPTDPTDWVPPTLRATVGDKVVYLSWNGVLRADSASVTVSRVLTGGGVEDIGTIPLASPKMDRLRVVALPGTPGGPLVNGTAYRFGLTLVRKSVTRQPGLSEVVLAKPAAFTIEPRFPTLFLHGFGGRGDAQGSFADTLDFAANTLGWTFGGRFCFPGRGLSAKVDLDFAGVTQRASTVPDLGPAGNAVCDSITTTAPDSAGEFFTVDFGNNFANYGVDAFGGGLFHQSAEVDAMFTKFDAAGITVLGSPTKRVSIVGQGTGGLAARHYLAHSQNGDNQAAELVTYGSPHLGADTGYWCAASTNPKVTALGGMFANLIAGLVASGACTDPSAVGGVRDTLFTCGEGGVQPSLFLSDGITMPNTLPYTSVVSSWHVAPWTADSLPNGGNRTGDCLGVDWDAYAPVFGADLNDTGILENPGRTLPSDRFTVTEGQDIATVYCALEPRCLIVTARPGQAGQVLSPVELTVTGPDGRVVSRQRVEIPGAGVMSPVVSGKESEIIVLPFVATGSNTYKVTLTAKPGAAPSATYRLEAVHNGTTVLVGSGRVDAIPAAGYSIPSVTGR